MINPTSSQGFMSGLVTLLQMSLSARLTRNQSSRTEHILSLLNGVLSATSKAKPSMTPKAMGELSQLEQKHQLMKEIGRLLSGHQSNKLINAEQMIQGQETFYYNLPSAMGGIFKDVELLIKREEDHKEKPSADEQNNKTWQLTMKLSVGKLGELLTKAKLRGDTLDINFYASNETVKNQIMNYLPLLRRKLDSLGIEVSKSQCQLGKIPDTLQQRPHHVFKAKA
jgi:flagellar hook-length control protein FliK